MNKFKVKCKKLTNNKFLSKIKLNNWLSIYLILLVKKVNNFKNKIIIISVFHQN